MGPPALFGTYTSIKVTHLLAGGFQVLNECPSRYRLSSRTPVTQPWIPNTIECICNTLVPPRSISFVRAGSLAAPIWFHTRSSPDSIGVIHICEPCSKHDAFKLAYPYLDISFRASTLARPRGDIQLKAKQGRLSYVIIVSGIRKWIISWLIITSRYRDYNP